MITRHHITLSLICSLIAGLAIVPWDLFLLILLAAGTCIGVILPDIQMKAPKRITALTPAWMITRFARLICVPVICSSYRLIPGIDAPQCDKRLTHSVPGILFIFLIIAGIQYSIVLFLGASPQFASAPLLLAGILLGLCLHLAEDLCTRKGITPLYPFSTLRLSGTIRPCDTRDGRIRQFSIQHGLVLAGFVGLRIAGLIPEREITLAALLGLILCTGLMGICSSVKVADDDEPQQVPPGGISGSAA
ncbi:MAG: metal-dependent hydrolase [Methanoregula sp.]|nr:metal-dependent hydrolase [Methanoregula sp.]